MHIYQHQARVANSCHCDFARVGWLQIHALICFITPLRSFHLGCHMSVAFENNDSVLGGAQYQPAHAAQN